MMGGQAASVMAQTVSVETLWRTETGGAIHGRPTVDGEVLYVGGEDGVLRALNRSSGEEVWAYEAGAGIGSGTGFDDARAFVISRDGVVHGVDKVTGNGLWTFKTGGEKQWDYWDYYLSTPLADQQDSLYFGTGDHHVYALNKRSGALRWKFETGAILHGDPVLSGEKFIVGSIDGKMYAHDRTNGKALWPYKTVGNY
jgi:outer membrane protein assembly factor BamB